MNTFAAELAELIKKYNATVYSAKEYDDATVIEFAHPDEAGNVVFTTLLDFEIAGERVVKVAPRVAKG